jgi:AraC family transcriptional regulator
MNAPYPPALLHADCLNHVDEPVDAADLLPETVRLSSRQLGWGPLNIERREMEPGSSCLPAGTSEHLIFINLADGHCVREGRDAVSDTEFETGHISIHPSATPVRWEWDTRLSVTVLAMAPAFLQRVGADVFGLDVPDLQLKIVERQRDPVITNIAGVLSREVLHADAGSRVLAESLASQLAVHLIRTYTQRPHHFVATHGAVPPRAVSQAVDFIGRNYARDISLGEIAAAAHLSPFHLARLFKKVTGVTPHQYLVQVRVHSARSLLTAGAGARSLADIAVAVGFSDQSHLTRQFKRVLGVTPKHLRQ